MDSKQVEKYIERYWEGNSTIEEERLIRDFYAFGKVPEHLEMYREVFQDIEISIVPELGREFDEKVMMGIEEKKSSNSWAIFRIAAIGLILLITSISVFKIDSNKQQLVQDTVNTPEAALAETKKAFLMIAEAMNKGEQHTMVLSKLDKTNEKIKTKE